MRRGVRRSDGEVGGAGSCGSNQDAIRVLDSTGDAGCARAGHCQEEIL